MSRKFFDDSAQMRAYVQQLSGKRAILAFSRGKDALGAWLALRDSGFEVIPYHMDLFPGLEFIEESIAYYERFFGVRIHRYPHPSFYRQLESMMFQTPDRVTTINRMKFRRGLDYEHVTNDVRTQHKADDAWVSTGVRATDSPTRMMAVRKYGPLNYSRMSMMAIYDWKSAQLLEALKRSGAKLPIDYRIWGRTLDGVDYRFLSGLKAHFPGDYERALKWFPLAELELKRREWAAQKGRVAE